MPDKSTQPRLDVTKVSPDLYKAMASLEKYVEASGLEQKLLDLVKIRASLQRTRARRARLDRSGDKDQRRSCARRGVRRGTPPVF
jgi:hypothetical protein